MGAELCLAHDMGRVEAYGGVPFGRHAALWLFHFFISLNDGLSFPNRTL